jgi:hypothetical protein
MPVDIDEIISHQGFAPGYEEKEATGLSDFIDNRQEEFRVHFMMTHLPHGRWGTQITVDASQIALVGKVNATREGYTEFKDLLVKRLEILLAFEPCCVCAFHI